MSRGRFLTLEGGEGSGKTTQAERLRATLAARGLPVLVTREPGGAPGAESIRNILVTGETGRWDPLSEALLHAAARREHVTRTIVPALEAGTWVLSDRFGDSTMAYQGITQGVGRDTVASLNALVLGDLAPDLTLVLDVAEDVGLAREQSAHEDRYGTMGSAFHAAVRAAFRDIAAAEPGRCILIDASGAVDEVHAAILAAVTERLGL